MLITCLKDKFKVKYRRVSMDRIPHVLRHGLEKIKYSDYTTIRTGGTGFAYFPETVCDAVNIIRELHKYRLKYKVFGNFSNVIISDNGLAYPSVITTEMKNYCVNGEYITAECGIKLPFISKIAENNGLSGLEFACSIPATLGGAVRNNAGAFGGEIFDVLESIYIMKNGRISELKKKDLSYSYHRLDLQCDIILSAVIKLKKTEKKKISDQMKFNKEIRFKTQPAGFSAGSIFKKYAGLSAGKIIDDCGLKCMRVNGAVISPKHANFIINESNATSYDIYKLARFVKRYVFGETNIKLEEEVEYVGEFKNNNEVYRRLSYTYS